MKPVTVSVTVARPREEVFEYVDVLANHETYMDHMFVDWKFSGPRRGVGATARARVEAPASREMIDFEVVESEAPLRTVEEATSAHGKRHTRGTYRLEETADGGTEVSFELAWLKTPRTERMVPPLTHAFLRRSLGKGLKRLAKELEAG
jgi:Polyketide cyclase / dehydrase and lipid transport